MYQDIASGDIVWIQCRFLPRFLKEIVPKTNNPYVLVISDGDESFPADSGLNEDEVETFLNNPNLIHIFAQNCDYSGSSQKVSRLPIGMDFHTIAYKGYNGGWGEKGSPQGQENSLNMIRTLYRQPTFENLVLMSTSSTQIPCTEVLRGICSSVRIEHLFFSK